MPSPQPLPTIDDLLDAAGNAIVGERDRFADRRRGSLYDHATGPTAILFAQEADRDLDSFRAIYFDDADGLALTKYVQGRFDVSRILDTYGEGFATFARSSNAAGAGDFREGSRISIPGTPPSVYVVAEDTSVAAAATMATIPIRADVKGTGSAISVSGGTLTLIDPVYDPLWTPTSVICEDGTDFEPADQYRARARAATLDARNGYFQELKQVCLDAGAAYVIGFASNYGLDAGVFTDDDVEPVTVAVTTFGPAPLVAYPGPHGFSTGDWIQLSSPTKALNGAFEATVTSPTELTIQVSLLPNLGFQAVVAPVGEGDYGLNAIYVADKNFASTPALVNACTIALEGARVLGADLWVGGIVQTPVKIAATLNLVDDPSRLQTVPIVRSAAQALLAYFGPTEGGYLFKLAAMGGAITGSNPSIQAATFTSPASDTSLTPRAWPANLLRFTLNPRDISFTLAGPV